jgi:ABC-type Fe3+ transport system substrate-binding protein
MALRHAAGVALTVLTVLFAIPAQAQDATLIAAAQKEGKVVWYTGLIVNQIVRPLCEAFQAKYGINATYNRHDENELAMVFNAEVRAGRMQVDVMGSVAGVTDTIPTSQMEPYTPAAAADYTPDFSTPDGIWRSTNVIIHTAGINTSLVKPEDAPRTYQDLLNPKWKGRIAWTASLGMAGPPGFIGAVLTTMGHDSGMNYLKQLSEQKIINIRGTPRAVLDQVIAGEYPLALQIVSYHASISAAQGAPTTWLRMEPVIANHNYVGLVKHAPHPNAARLFIEFALSEEGQMVFQKAGYIPANPKIRAGYPDTKPQDGRYEYFLLTPELASAHYQEWLRVYNDLFK